MGFAVSMAKTEITPTADAPNPYLGGYGTADGGREVSSTVPYEPIYVRVLVLWDGDAPNALVVADVLEIPVVMNDAIRNRLLPLAEWGESDIVLQATHTHSGPVLVDTLDPFMAYGLNDLSEVEGYSAWLEDRVVEAVQDALNAPKNDVTLDYQVTTQNFAINRVGLPYTETDVPVLVARDMDGLPVAVVFGYGCHPVAAGIGSLYDGDFAAGACSVVEAETGAFALFLQGAAGDQNPVGTPAWDLRDQLAQSLGSAVVDAAASPGRELAGPVATAAQPLALPLDVDISPDNLDAVRADYEERLPNPLGHPPWYRRHAEVMIDRIDAGTIETTVPSGLQLWTIGGDEPLRILWIAGEIVSGYAFYVRDNFGGSDAVWVNGYLAGSVCYIPSAEFFPPATTLGSYEGGWDADDFPGIGGGSMTVYGHLGHFMAGAAGIEASVIAAIEQLLA